MIREEESKSVTDVLEVHRFYFILFYSSTSVFYDLSADLWTLIRDKAKLAERPSHLS